MYGNGKSPESSALEELLKFAKGGMAKDMRARHGIQSEEQVEVVPGSEDDSGGMASDTESGMEAPNVDDTGTMPGTEGIGAPPMGEEEIDPEMLQMILAKMKASPGV